MTTEGLQREIDRFLTRTPRSRELQEEAVKWLPGGNSRGTHHDPNPVFVDYGEGHYFYDADGNRYLDFMLNATSLIMGHANPIVVEAIAEQAGRGTGFVGPNERAVRLARILCERVPSLDKVRFVNSGTEATLNTIRAARAFTGKHKVAKFLGAYHGSHEYASVSVKPSADLYGPDGPPATLEFPGQPPSLLEDVIVLPWNDLETCERILRRNASDLAGVIMEPIASTLGFPPTRSSFLEGIRDLTTELDMLLIFDEVQTLRTSPGGAQEMLGVAPDLTAMGKMVGGGLPAGAFGGRGRHHGAVRPARRGDDSPRRHIQCQPADDGRGRGHAQPHDPGGLRATQRPRRDDPRKAPRRLRRAGGARPGHRHGLALRHTLQSGRDNRPCRGFAGRRPAQAGAGPGTAQRGDHAGQHDLHADDRGGGRRARRHDAPRHTARPGVGPTPSPQSSPIKGPLHNCHSEAPRGIWAGVPSYENHEHASLFGTCQELRKGLIKGEEGLSLSREGSGPLTYTTPRSLGRPPRLRTVSGRRPSRRGT